MSRDVTNCPSCLRTTPGARATCLYCGAALSVTRIDAAPAQRNLEPFEYAFNVILHPPAESEGQSKREAFCAAMQIEMEEAVALLSTPRPVPVARCQNEREADLIVGLLRGCGIGAEVVPDVDLRIDFALVRAKRVTRSGGDLEIGHSGGTLRTPVEALRSLVVGCVRSNRTDYAEGLTGIRIQGGNVLETAEFLSEQFLVDVYCGTLEGSFRIRADAFDYSGLVKPLSYRTDLNFQALLAALRQLAPQATLNEDYAAMRGALARAWPERSRSEAQGLRRKGLAYRPVAKSTLVKDNADQFERYSRLSFVLGSRPE